jgi:hypothetical protein
MAAKIDSLFHTLKIYKTAYIPNLMDESMTLGDYGNGSKNKQNVAEL